MHRAKSSIPATDGCIGQGVVTGRTEWKTEWKIRKAKRQLTVRPVLEIQSNISRMDLVRPYKIYMLKAEWPGSNMWDLHKMDSYQ